MAATLALVRNMLLATRAGLGLWLALSFELCGSGCSGACRDGTLYLTLSYDSVAVAADQLTVDITVGDQQRSYPMARTAGRRSDSVEIAFHPYEKGVRVVVAVRAMHDGVLMGAAQSEVMLHPTCSTMALAVDASALPADAGAGLDGALADLALLDGAMSGAGDDLALPPADDFATPPLPPDLTPPRDMTPTAPVITFSGLTPTAQFPSGTSNPAYSDACLPGEALIGFNLQVQHDASGADQGIDRVDGVCAHPDVQPDGSGGWKVLWGKVDVLTGHGVDGQAYVQYVCGANMFLTGFSGRSGLYLDRLIISCSNLTFNDRSISVGTPVDSNTGIGSATGGSAFAPVYCPAGQVATVVRTRDASGFPFDAFGYGCSTVAAF